MDAGTRGRSHPPQPDQDGLLAHAAREARGHAAEDGRPHGGTVTSSARERWLWRRDRRTLTPAAAAWRLCLRGHVRALPPFGRPVGAQVQEAGLRIPKPTPPDPTQALDYVARTHKVAIGDRRIKAICHGRVTYTWRDRSQENIEKTETLPNALFTRRFLAHILPDGFHKIRSFGWMAAVHRKAILAAIRQAIPAEAPPPPAKESLAERVLRRTGVDITLCPHCGKGHLQRTDRLIPPHRGQAP